MAKRKVVDLESLRRQMQQQVEYVAGVPEQFTKPVTYVFTAEGAYEVRKTPYALMTAKVDRVEGISPRKPDPGVVFLHGKVPFSLLLQALDFFRQAYASPRKSEALYMIFFDPQTKTYVPYVPRQWDGPAHAKEIDPKERPAGMSLVAHIHSHPGFAGQFSGIDNADDRQCADAAIFGVLGHIDRDVPEMEWRINVGGQYVNLDVFDIFTSPFDPAARDACHAPAEWLSRIEDPPAEKTQSVAYPQAEQPWLHPYGWNRDEFFLV